MDPNGEGVGPWTKYASQPAPATTPAAKDEAGPWSKYATSQTTAAPATQDPPERPGFFKRLAQSFGIPDSSEGASAAKDEADITKHPENLIPLVSGAKMVGRMAGAAIDKAKTAYGEAREAQQNIDAGGPVSANHAKMMFSGLPDIAQGYGEDINNKNYLGAAGTATGVMGQAALAKLPTAEMPKPLSKIKSGLLVGDDLKNAAALTPDTATVDTARRTAGEIHQAAVPELSQAIGAHIDKVAGQLGVDTTNTASLSTKAELAGRGAKTAGQKLYAQLDKAATEVAGAEGGRFQRYAETIRNLERQSLDPSLTATQGEAITERLNNAKAEFSAFKQEMIKRGLSEATIKQADKFWAQGSALDELSRHLLNAEDATGAIKPSARPLDTQVKKLTAPASPRGHILKQATGDSADAIAQATRRAQERIVTDKAATQAAKRSIKETAETAKTAQKRIDTIRGRQKAIGAGALGILGIGALGRAASTAKDVLSGQ